MTAFARISELIDAQTSFVLEAGAGSGKTFTLIQTLNYVLGAHGKRLQLNNQKIVCITYTNVAKNEIIDRLENNPIVLVLTVHEFLWGSINNYQRQLLAELNELNNLMAVEKPEKFTVDVVDRNNLQEVIYNDSGYRDFENGALHHDDVITIASSLLKKYPILSSLLADRYPYIFIDEYQDTAPEVVSALIDSLLEKHNDKTLLGFFGDSYQKIYDGGVGDLDKFTKSGKLTLVSKEENYRSSERVIEVLNNIRSNIEQKKPDGKTVVPGSAIFINCDNYPEKGKLNVADYERLLVPIKNRNYDKVVSLLDERGWNFNEKSKDKVLIIANSRVAERAGFGDLYRLFSGRYSEGANDQLLKRDHVLIRFFLGSVDRKTSKERRSGVEHLASYLHDKNYNGVVSFLNAFGSQTATGAAAMYFSLRHHGDKKRVADVLEDLYNLRYAGTVSEVFNFVVDNQIIINSESFERYLARLSLPPDQLRTDEDRARQQRDIELYNSVMALPYIEFMKLFKHTQNQTVFSTKHGTKGDEFRNVLVVIDDTSWKQKYNFQKFINESDDNAERMLRTRNLFYVSCSRAIDNLVVISLSEMDSAAMRMISNWFGDANVFSIATI